jgi:predicted AAA+ superfamily ATPase
MKYKRLLVSPSQSFFLFGPRGTGKSSWLRDHFKPDLSIDLLKSEEYLRFSTEPELLRDRVAALPDKSKVVIDEIQKVPALLDEVHSLMFSHEGKYQFALTGSSARKLKQAEANMLAGRAVKREMFPLCSKELGSDFSPELVMKFGSLPALFSLSGPEEKIDFLYAYVETYLREEILREALVRKLQNYQRFLKHAAFMNAQVTNMNNISREAGVARSTVEGYFEILVDTLLGTFVEPIHLKAKIKEVAAPKFYFFDCGVVRALRNELSEGLGEQAGYLLETLILNEIRAYSSSRNLNLQIHYWGTPSGTEVDFIICKGRKKVAIEVKSSKRWDSKFNRGLHSCSSSNELDKLIGVYKGASCMKLDGVEIFPVKDFCAALFAGEII